MEDGHSDKKSWLQDPYVTQMDKQINTKAK